MRNFTHVELSCRLVFRLLRCVDDIHHGRAAPDVNIPQLEAVDAVGQPLNAAGGDQVCVVLPVPVPVPVVLLARVVEGHAHRLAQIVQREVRLHYFLVFQGREVPAAQPLQRLCSAAQAVRVAQ